jgi:hypothetical protein
MSAARRLGDATVRMSQTVAGEMPKSACATRLRVPTIKRQGTSGASARSPAPTGVAASPINARLRPATLHLTRAMQASPTRKDHERFATTLDRLKALRAQ